MKKFYKNSELGFSLMWIGIYVTVLSICDNASAAVGIRKAFTAPVCVAMTAFIYLWIRKNNLLTKYGLCKCEGMNKGNLFYIPLMLIVSTNLWFGLSKEPPFLETALGIISMLCVGFIEEIIFRGFLFKALAKDNLKQAVIISSLTFGIGHIVNLLNGAEVIENLMQICYAVAIGFLFTILFLKGGSLWPCIITHSLVNSLSVIADEGAKNSDLKFVTSAFLCVVPVVYGVYIIKESKKKK